MTDPESAEENTDYVGEPVEAGQDVLSGTPEPDDEDDDGSFGRGNSPADLSDDPLGEPPAAT
jgi:hypothetical protein